jgi:hypothetical protein
MNMEMPDVVGAASLDRVGFTRPERRARNTH